MSITISFNSEDSRYNYSPEISENNIVENNPNETNIWNDKEDKISQSSIGEALQGEATANNADILELSSAKSASSAQQVTNFQDNTIRLDKLITDGKINKDELTRTQKIISLQGSSVYQNAEMNFTMSVIAKNRNYFYGKHDNNKLMEAWNFVKENVGKNIDFSENKTYKNFAPAEQKIIQDSFKEITGKDIDFTSKAELVPQEKYNILSEYASLFD